MKTSTSFLGEFYNSKGDFWTAVVKVNDNDTRFKLDTGAVVSIVSDRELWLKDQQLSNTQQILRVPGGTILSEISKIETTDVLVKFQSIQQGVW